MYLLYIDESGTPEIPGNTSHYILCGLALPIEYWKTHENQIQPIKAKYDLADAEIHTGWIIKVYAEQRRIPDFEKLPYSRRRLEVDRIRTAELLRLQNGRNKAAYEQTKKTYRKTKPYTHLTYAERVSLIEEIATVVSGWGHARLFAECIDKIHFSPSLIKQTISEQAFEQVVSRFEKFLSQISSGLPIVRHGLLIHDNNQTVAKRLTEMMRNFHKAGTLWTRIQYIIETPLFVDSSLTSMVQIADVCAYALRRYLENGEDKLFDIVFKRADTKQGVVVGVRHFTNPACKCKICKSHRVP